jgi:RluA family pseudouridine synthase
MVRKIIVAAGQSGRRLESVLTRDFPIGYVRKLFRKNGVRLNGRRGKAGDPVHPGDRIEIFIPFEPASAGGTGPELPLWKLDVLFESADLLALNKPPGVAVHEARGIPRNRTVAGLLETYLRQTSSKPLLVHRLDRDTSGVLLAAKNPEAAQELEDSFKAGTVNKEYLCLLAGRLPRPSGTVDFPLPGREGKPVSAITHYQVEKYLLDTTLARVILKTGRMHQIRLHFAKFGYPVVMDRQHGDFAFNKAFRQRTGLKRQFLHAARLGLVFRGKHCSWEAPLPDDLQRALRAMTEDQRGMGSQHLPHSVPPARRG